MTGKPMVASRLAKFQQHHLTYGRISELTLKEKKKFYIKLWEEDLRFLQLTLGSQILKRYITFFITRIKLSILYIH